LLEFGIDGNRIISEIKPVGADAVKIYSDDGHNAGLKDWANLYRLGRKQILYCTDTR
jgi:DUF971 family protein